MSTREAPPSPLSSSSVGFPADPHGDVDDYSWEKEGSLPLDIVSHVYDLVQHGNSAFRESLFEEAISCYTRANSIKPTDPVILGNRSAAYIRISRFLKGRPPSASELRALNGLDPTIHAELAVKDAEKLMDLQRNTVKPYALKCNALILGFVILVPKQNAKTMVGRRRELKEASAKDKLGQLREELRMEMGTRYEEISSEIDLEKYDLARDVVMSGLQIDPFSKSLQASLQSLETAPATLQRGRGGKPERIDDFDCTLCLKLLYDPITTPCGHSFCRSCLFQSMDRGNKCPLCRTVLFISPRTCAISVTLNNIIQKNFPEEYAERKSENEGLTKLGANLMPLFVMDVVIPCQKFPLNIFEPRYRLMVRRIMEGNHRMGMVMIDSTSSIADFACEVEITECEPLPDGRFYLEIESRRRFRIIRSWDQDGYRVAEVEWVQDVIFPEGSKERSDLLELTNNAAKYARSWIQRAKEASRQGSRRHEKVLNVEALMPSPQDPERFSFWLLTLSNRRPLERLDLLRMRDTNERIRRALVYLKAEEQSCHMQ